MIMTQEEKARAYDEALERAKEQIKECGDNEGRKKMIQNIFPELHELEDEKTRKALIQFLNDIKSFSESGRTSWAVRKEDAEMCNGFIAYLEKQKYDRMKPVYDNQDSFESALGKAWKDYNDSGAITVDGCEDNYVECAHAKGFREGYLFGLEKQKEYHIPWYDYQKSKEAGYTIVPNEEYEQLIKQKEHKPVECSEVELEFRGEKVTVKRPFYRDDKGRGYSTAELDEGVAWSALRAWCEKKGISLYDLYPKAEWSEEDESELTAVIYCVSQAIKASKDENERNSLLSAKKWLQDKLSFRVKSLRPSWKPSEEQLNALNFAITFGYNNPTELRELYEQLKKL